MHPLATVLGDGATHPGWFTVSHAAPATSLAALSADTGGVRAAVTAELASFGVDLPHIGASFLLGRTAWRVLGPLALPYVRLGVVPSLTPSEVGMASLTVRADEVAQLHLRPGRFVAVAGTAAAEHPAATPVTDAEELRDELQRRAGGLLEALIMTLRPWARRSVRNQRAVVDDALAAVLLTAGHSTAGVAARPVRRTCCFAYQLPGQPLCATCPLHPDHHRSAARGRSASP